MNAESSTAPPLCRLLYQSETSWDLLSNEALQDIARHSRENNARQDITGLLLLTGERFLQVLEGPPPAVNALYLKIARDERHHDLALLDFAMVGERLFPAWAMHVVDLDNLSLDARRMLAAKYPVSEDSVQIPEPPVLALSLLLDAMHLVLPEADR
jgi:hypothetical protein